MTATPRLDPADKVGGRYSYVAIVLHWLIAAVIVFQVFLGWRMGEASGAARSSLLSLHKSIGLTILLLSLARLGWRLANPPPAEPASVTLLERKASTLVHWCFYGIMIGLPLTGWMMISATRAGIETYLFGVVPWPRLPLSVLPPSAREAVSNFADISHVALIWLTLILFALHVSGALKHHLISRDSVLSRMAPGGRSGSIFEPRLAVIGFGAVVAGALAYAPRPSQPPPPRPKPVSLAVADVYLDVVQPALTRRCETCHNDDRSKGGLSLVSYEAVMAGGKDGPMVVPGAPGKSILYKRITLPSTHDQYMPADGKTPLTDAQVSAIGWWISVGAPASGKVGQIKVSEAARPALEMTLGLVEDSGGAAAGRAEKLPTVAKGDERAVRSLEAAGFIVRPVAAGSNLLDVNLYAQRDVTPEDLSNLAKLQMQVRTLILRQAGVSDSALKTIGRMENLTHLRLEENPISDAGLSSLTTLKSLRFVNLYGTKISDGGVRILQQLPRLERVYAWQTAVTKTAAANAHVARPTLRVELESLPAVPKGQVPASAPST